MEYKVGDWIIFPPEGLAKIESKESIQVKENSSEEMCWKINFSEKRSSFWISLEKASENFRPLISGEKAQELLKILKAPATASGRTFIDRFLKHPELEKSFDPELHAKILGELYQLKTPLTYAEKKSKFVLEDLVLDEISQVLGIQKTELLGDS